MNKQPHLILAIWFILGIFFQDQILWGKTSIGIIIFMFSGMLILLFFHSYYMSKIRAILLASMFFFLGIILHSFNTFYDKNDLKESKGLMTFKISRKLNSTDKYRKYEVIGRVEKMNVTSVLYVPKVRAQLDFNHYYKAQVFISKVKPPLYDFQFNYSGYLKRRHIAYQMYVYDDVLSAARTDLSFKERIQQKRLEVLQSIDKISVSIQSREFLKGIILADRTEMDPSTVEDFSKSGLVHFLAISGTHIMVVFGLFYYLLKLIFPLKLRRYVLIMSLVFIWMFAGFIGFGNSVLRSCIMLTAYFMYVLLQRKPDVLHAMALSAFIILILDTHQLFNVGFQLSFMAVSGIFWLNEPILKWFPKQDNYLKKLVFNTVSISVSAQLATFPLVLYYFHQFSFISIVANFIIVPFSELIIIFSLIMTILITLKINLDIVNTVYDMTIDFLLRAIHWFAGFDILFFENIPLNLVEVFILLIILYRLRFVILEFNLKNKLVFMMTVLLFYIARISFNIKENVKEEILIFSMGKDKGVLIKKGNRACFWSTNNSDNKKNIRYIVNPYTTFRRLKSIEIKSLAKSAKRIVYNGKIYDIK
ncbi:hypothetical protein CEY12_11945 [Chryseobacterium sp. T16E-39]|uniref:ComEC/Rec2 family competence protein n=1 Tax=Chryseobacterium sp. T16E-39 TaxID=2015076 RepID=UPI000B5B112E|nr:ComEC/Rec2 family competence protein [Chryseobacterium sp. T16E-39]ASK30780.1 hypothetical protein CEY12_11945 [Chryseobacterium sp. T16E-39]